MLDMTERMGLTVRSEDVSDIIRISKKDGNKGVKPVITEFKSEYDKWTVLRNKADLRGMEEYNFFIDTDRSREEREVRSLMVRMNARICVLSGRM